MVLRENLGLNKKIFITRYKWGEGNSQPLNSLKLYYLEKFINEYSHKCQLIVTLSPMYGAESSQRYDIVKKICQKYNVIALDHFADSRFVNHPQLFNDTKHMNDAGARLYTSIVAHEIKEMRGK